MNGIASRPETIAEVIDRVERMRDELLHLQTFLEKMEVAKRFGKQDEPKPGKETSR